MIQFPSTPTLYQQFIADTGVTYVWLGDRWSSTVNIADGTSDFFYNGGHAGDVFNPATGVIIGQPTLGFTISPSDFTASGGGSGTTNVSHNGFSTTSLSYGPGNECYSMNLSGGNVNKIHEIRAYFSSNGLNTNGGNSYMFNVSWSAGSTLSSGVVILELFDNGDNNFSINLGVVDTSNPIWQTSGTGYYSGSDPIKTLIGTWLLPATFSVVRPLITDANNWC